MARYISLVAGLATLTMQSFAINQSNPNHNIICPIAINCASNLLSSCASLMDPRFTVFTTAASAQTIITPGVYNFVSATADIGTPNFGYCIYSTNQVIQFQFSQRNLVQDNQVALHNWQGMQCQAPGQPNLCPFQQISNNQNFLLTAY